MFMMDPAWKSFKFTDTQSIMAATGAFMDLRRSAAW